MPIELSPCLHEGAPFIVRINKKCHNLECDAKLRAVNDLTSKWYNSKAILNLALVPYNDLNVKYSWWPICESSWLEIQRSRVRFPLFQIF
jgi:hypothetical protein